MRRNIAGQRITFSLFKTGARIANPTMAAGDFKVDLDGAGQANVFTLPTSDAAGLVQWLPTQAETNATVVTFLANDALGAEWEPLTISFDTTTDTTIALYLDAAITAIPASVWAHGVRTLTSFGTLVADITTAISAILCNVWNCSSRTLTMSLAAVKSMLLGSKLELWRGDTLAQTFTGLGDLSAVTDLWFTVKKQDLNDLDSAAEIQISLTGGLLAIAGATATTPANGSIVINLPATQGSITVNLAAAEMAKLDIDFTGYWDIQKLTGAVVQTITRGNAAVLGDVTRRIV